MDEKEFKAEEVSDAMGLLSGVNVVWCFLGILIQFFHTFLHVSYSTHIL